YRFAGLGAGNYLVEIDLPAGFRSSPGVARSHEPAPGPNNDVDNDDNGTRFGGVVRSGTVTLAPFAEPANDGDGDVSTNLTVDFGLAPRLDQNEVGPFAVGAGPGGPTQVEYRNPDQMVAFAVDAFPGFAGGVRTAVADVNGDGVPDLVA